MKTKVIPTSPKVTPQIGQTFVYVKTYQHNQAVYQMLDNGLISQITTGKTYTFNPSSQVLIVEPTRVESDGTILFKVIS